MLQLKVDVKCDLRRNQTLTPSLSPLGICMYIASLLSKTKTDIVVHMVCHSKKAEVKPVYRDAKFFCTGPGHRNW